MKPSVIAALNAFAKKAIDRDDKKFVKRMRCTNNGTTMTPGELELSILKVMLGRNLNVARREIHGKAVASD